MAITKVIKDLTEFNPGNPDYVLNATNAVTVINAGGNQYNFNGVYGKFGLRIGTTVLTGVPSAHPIAVLNNGLTGITYTGTVNQGTLAVGGITYTFYSGDVTITVTGNFGVASYYCKFHQYMGGQDNLVSVYSTAGLKMPTGAAYSGTTEDGMIRNDTDGTSQGSTSTMQHYNGTEWKNFVNTPACTTATCDYPVTGSILYQFEDNANNTCPGGTYDATAGSNVSYSASGKYGKAAEFTASTASASDVVTVPDAVANLIINDFTVSFWMKPDNLNYASSGYVNPVGLQKGRRFYIDITSAGSISTFNGSTVLASANSIITTGSWFNVVYTQSSSTGRVLYIDKVSVANDGTTSDTVAYNPGNSENVIGGYKTSSAWGLMFDGLIDQFRIFPSVLGQADVDKLYDEIPC